MRILQAPSLSLAALLTLAACGSSGGGGGSAPTIRVIAPSTGAVVGGIQTVRWTPQPSDAGTVTLSLSSDGGSTFPDVIAMDTADDGTFNWETLPTSDGSYVLRVAPTLGGGGTATAFDSGAFSVDNTAPVTVATGPEALDVVGGDVTLTWGTTDNNPGTVAIRLSSDSGGTFPTVLASAAPDSGSFVFDSRAIADGSTYRVEIVPTDAAGNEGAPTVTGGDFSLDNTAPTLTLTAPVGGEALDGTEAVTWTTVDTNPGTVEIAVSSDSGSSFGIDVEAAAPDTGSFAWNTGLVPDGTTYRLSATAVDRAGNRSAAAVSATDFSVTNMRIDRDVVYTDDNANGVLDGGDKLLVRFDKNIVLNGPVNADLDLPAAGDTLGTGASFAVTGNPFEMEITLGTSPALTLRGTFDADSVLAGAASGLDVSSSLTMDAIESLVGGIDATPSNPRDLIAGWIVGPTMNPGDGTTADLGDVDGDGDLDLVTGHVTAETGTCWLNDGTGTFSASPAVLDNQATTGVALGDLNGDGFLDAFMANASGGSNTVWFGDGTGDFSNSAQALGSGDSRGVVLLDVDADGDLDAAVVNATGQANRIWRNDGAGLFSDTGQNLGSSNSVSVVSGDVDGDGDPDLVVGNNGTSQSNRIWLNDGSGTFVSGSAVLVTNTRRVRLGDMDQDGDLDVVILNTGQGRVAFNNGTGSFTDSGIFFGNGDNRGLAVVDMDQDGDLDVVTGQFLTSERIFLNEDGMLRGIDLFTGAASTEDLVAGDLDGDGDVDFIAINSAGSDQVYLASNVSATPTFTVGTGMVGAMDTTASAAGDLNGDGNPDLVLGVAGAGSSVWLGDGAGGFTDTGVAAGSTEATDLALADLDGDGSLDLVTSHLAGGNRVLLGDGAGAFTDTGLSLGSGDTTAIDVGDVDRDGDLDLVFANDGTADRVFLGDGAGGFTDSGQALGTDDSTDAILADLDGDGQLDLAIGIDGAACKVYSNAAGVFTLTAASVGGSATASLVPADMDGDGDLDLVEGTDGAFNRVWRNDGAFSFVGGSNFASGSSSAALVAEDVNRDGNVDIVCGNTGAAGASVFLGDGTGALGAAGFTLGTDVPSTLTLTDVDTDGDLDAIVGVSGAADSIWLQN